MLIISITLGVLVVFMAIDQIRLAKLAERISKLERERDMWKLAASNATRESERMSRELMG